MTDLTDVVIADVCNKLRISGSLDTALMLAGITRKQFEAWAEETRVGMADAMVRRFIDATQEAESEVKLMREHQLSKYFEKNWQALAWWLERKYPDEYAQRKPTPREGAPDEFQQLQEFISGKR